MEVDLTAFSHIATALAKHFDCLYYVDIETNDYIEFIQPKILATVNIPKEGKDFFVTATKNAYNYVHPDDLEEMLKIHDKENVLKNLAKGKSYSVSGRADRDMYEHKNLVKSRKGMEKLKSQYGSDVEIPEERKRMLDSLFGALHTVAGGGYIYLCDMRYDYSRWALSIIDDFGLKLASQKRI